MLILLSEAQGHETGGGILAFRSAGMSVLRMTISFVTLTLPFERWPATVSLLSSREHGVEVEDDVAVLAG